MVKASLTLAAVRVDGGSPVRSVLCGMLLLAAGPVWAGSTDIAAPWAGELIVQTDVHTEADMQRASNAKIIPTPESGASVTNDETVVPQTVPSLKKKAILNGFASFYDIGRVTANGERFQPMGLTAAHRTLPFGTRILVTNRKTGKSVMVRVNDRGPFVRGRAIDLSRGAARVIGLEHSGLASVTMEVQ